MVKICHVEVPRRRRNTIQFARKPLANQRQMRRPGPSPGAKGHPVGKHQLDNGRGWMTKDLDLTSLRLFVAICDTGSIARVAERERLVPSAVSKRMAKLESDIGMPLLTQVRRGVEPTAAGLALAERARLLLRDANLIAEDMLSHYADAMELVRVMSTDSPVAGLLLDDTSDFLGQPAHCAIRLKLLVGKDHTAVLQAVRAGDVQFGVLWDALEMVDFQTLPYRGDQLAAVCHQHHPLAQQQQVALDDTLEYQHIFIGSANVAAAMLSRAKVIDAGKISVRVEVDNFYSAFRLVAADLGICVAPREAATKVADLFNLAVIPLTDAWASRRYVIAFRDETALTPAAKLLVHHLASAAKQA